MKLQVIDVAFAFGSRPVLDDVSFSVAPGELVGILGPNGAGKSTLLRCMHAALRVTRGSVMVDARALEALPRREVARRVGVVPQACSPGFRVSVAEFVGMGCYARETFLGGDGPEVLAKVERALGNVGMTSFRDRSVLELSGGEFRRVLIAQALAQETPVLLLDEPVQQLDLRHQIEVMELVRRLTRESAAAAVAVLHDISLAARYCDRLILLAAGRVHAVGTPQEVITEENLREVYGIEAAIDRCAATGSVRAVPIRAIDKSASPVNGPVQIGIGGKSQ